VAPPGTKGPHPYISLLPPPSPTLGGFLDLRRAAVVPCSHRASCSPPPPSPSAADLRRPIAPSVPSSVVPERRRRPPSSPTSAARPSSIRRPSAVGPPPRRRSAPLESPVRFAAVSSTLCVPPLARSGPASVAPAVVCLDAAAPAPARRRLRLDVAAPPPRRYSTRRHASTPTPRRRPCPRRGMGRPPAISFFFFYYRIIYILFVSISKY